MHMLKMMVRLLVLASAAMMLTSAHAIALAPVRQVVQLNRAWTFTLGDPSGASASSYADQDWREVNLPHSFSMPYFLGPGVYVGYGWYRKNIVMADTQRGKRLTLEFDGVFQDAEIFVNGALAGRHRGGYTGFSIDITRQLHPGVNTLAVRVNNLWNAQLAPRAGEHQFSGGIYRDVRLVATDPVHVAWYGTFVTTPEVSAQRAALRIQTEVANAAGVDRMVTLESTVYTPSGRMAAQSITSRTVRAGATVMFEQQPPAISRPSLWEPGNPAMYRLESRVSIGGRVVDDYSTPFGIRSIRWSADQGFFLNGKHVYLVGANIHQDHAGWGDAVTHAGAWRDIRMLKDAGFNFMRGSHYPHAPAFTQAADELGMMFWSEAPFWGMGGFGADGNWFASAYPPDPRDRAGFEESVLAQTADMIRIHRNHPSVIAWSNGNEYFFSAPETMEAVRAFVRRQVAAMRAQDSTRPAAVGGVQRGEVDRLGDVAGYNGDGAALQAYLNPGVANIVSEYGSTIAQRPGAYAPGWGDLTAPADQRGSSARYPWRYPWRSGEAIWAGFDHGTIADIDFGKMGMIDYFRIPKRQYYWYRNEYMQVPPPTWPVPGAAAQLSLTADKTVIKGTQGHDDVQLLVTVRDGEGKALSNSPDVTLEILEGPGEFPTGRTITFRHDTPIDIRDGQAAIEFRSYFAGKTTIRAASPGLKEAKLVIHTEGSERYTEGKSAIAKDRPLVSYPAAARLETGAAPANVVINRPTAASSSASAHPPSMANDGNGATYWQAAPSDTDPYWSVDLENIYALERVTVVPHAQAEAAYTLEVSLDRLQWQAITSAQLSGAVKARFLRVHFGAPAPGQPPALEEVQVVAATVRAAQ